MAAAVFETCGMVTEKGQWKPKPSFFLHRHSQKTPDWHALRRGDQSDQQPQRADLPFRHSAAGHSAYLIWSPTSDDRKIPNVSFAIPSKTATQIEFANDSLEGKSSPLPIHDRQVTLEVREKPIPDPLELN